MSDLLFQNLSTVQNALQPAPVTIASAATIAPTTFLTFVTGTTAIATIQPPVTGAHMLALVFTTTTPTSFATTGNIATGSTTLGSTANSNRPVLMIYNPLNGLYYQTNVV